MRKGTLLLLIAIAAIAGLALFFVTDRLDVAANGDNEQLASPPEKRELRYPNLGSHLDEMVANLEEGRATSQEAAESAPMHQDESVAVTIYLSGQVAEVVSFLEDNGGDPRNVGTDYIEAYVPVSLLGPVSERPGVTRVREIIPPRPAQLSQQVIGDGPAPHGSPAWNDSGFSGQGVKVGVIDLSFRGVTTLLGTELPSTIIARCYSDVGLFTNNLNDCEPSGDPPAPLKGCPPTTPSPGGHGTIVAESLLDIAPGVTLYVADPVSRGDLLDTVNWMASEGVQVVNYSVGYIFDGPGDGTSPSSVSPLNTVDRAVENGILWVSSAGNSGQETWFGGYSDSNGNGILEFGGAIGELIEMPMYRCIRHVVQLRWEDSWTAARTDLDLHLYEKSTNRIIYSSNDPQTGAIGHQPWEAFAFYQPANTNDYGIIVSHPSGEVPDWVQISGWLVYPLVPHTLRGSITNPAESANPGLLAVGASPWYDVNTIESFSSRGPAPDGRLKPEIVGVDCGETALRTYRPNTNRAFCGTSQAAPHLSGLAALVSQAYPGYGPAQVAGFLKNYAAERGLAGPDNTWGHGFAQLPSAPAAPVPPCPRDSFPCNLTATAGEGEVSLAWTNDPTHRQHQVYIKNLFTDERKVDAVGVADQHTVTRLTSGDEYEFWVRSRADGNSRWDDWSSSVKATPAVTVGPGTPTPTPNPTATPDPAEQCDDGEYPCDLEATAGDGQVRLSWKANPSHQIHQVFIRNTATREPDNAALGAVSGHTVTGLTNGDPYHFWVRSRADEDSSWGDWFGPVEATPSAGASEQTPGPTATPGPGTPTPTPTATPAPGEQCEDDEYPCNLAATVGDGQVTLSWTANSSHQSHQVFIRNTATKGHQVENLGTVSEHTVTGLDNGTEYHFWVRSRPDDDSRWGSWSLKVVATPSVGTSGQTPTPTATPGPGTPSPTPTATPDPSEQCDGDEYPCNLAATAGDGQVTLSWTANSSHQVHQVFVRNTVTKDYEVENLGGVSEHTVTELTNGTEYHFWVRSRPDDDSRWGDWSSKAAATPQAGTQ